jgi:hypothetical protein
MRWASEPARGLFFTTRRPIITSVIGGFWVAFEIRDPTLPGNCTGPPSKLFSPENSRHHLSACKKALCRNKMRRIDHSAFVAECGASTIARQF